MKYKAKDAQMSRRDWLAARAPLNAEGVHYEAKAKFGDYNNAQYFQVWAELAYQWADAMIKESCND